MANGIVGSLLILLRTKSDITAIVKTDRALRKVDKTSHLLRNSLRGLSALGLIFGGKNMISSYVEFEKSLGAIHSRLFAITGDSQKANAEFENIRGLAKDLGRGIGETADAYSIFFAGTAKGLGEEGARSVFESWSKVGRVLHMTPYQMERITYALREMSSKGKIYAQDLNMQIGTHVPNASGLALEAIKNLKIEGVKTLEDFQKVAKDNQPLISKFIMEFTKLAEAQFATPEALREAMKQPDFLLGRLRYYKDEFGLQFSKQGGRDLVVTTLTNLLKTIESANIPELAKSLVNVAKVITSLVNAIIRWFPDLITAIMIAVTSSVLGKGYRSLRKAGILALEKGKNANPFISRYARFASGPELLRAGFKSKANSFLHLFTKLARSILVFFGGWQVALGAIILSGVALIGKHVWTGLSEYLRDKKRTVENLQDVKNKELNLTKDAKKYQGTLSPSELEDLMKKQGIYLMYEGNKYPAKVSNMYEVSFNIANANMTNPQEAEDLAKQMAKEVLTATKEQIKRDAGLSLTGAFNK